MSPLGIAGFVLLAILAILVALLAVPVHVSGRARKEGTFEGRVRVRWLFVDRRIETGDAHEREPREARARPPAEKQEEKRRRSVRGVLHALRTEGLAAAARRLVARTIRSARVERFTLVGRAGAGDPADTGLLFGALAPALATLWMVPRANVSILPDFAHAGVAGELEGEARVVPLRALAAFVAFALTPATIRAWFRFRRAKRA